MNHPFLQPILFSNGKSLPDRILPGPMDGITAPSFVQVLSDAGLVRSWFTPFLRISNGLPRIARLKDKIAPYQKTNLPCIVQIMGTRIEHLAGTTARLHELGAACVDLNCGCPSPTVLSSHSGGYALKDPKWIAQALTAMRTASPYGGISVKIRIGFDSPEEMTEIAAALRDVSPDIIFVHYRTVREMYTPLSPEIRRQRFSRLRELMPKQLLLASGDINTVEDARELAEIGMDGVIPARGFLKNPALLQEIRLDCQGDKHTKQLSDQAKKTILLAIGQTSGRPMKERGFLIRMARMMFGDDSPETQEILRQLKNSD